MTEVTEAFRKHKELRIVDSLNEEEARVLTVHRGLDDETWDLESVFATYFPNLQRRGALITL